ncbi:hypothetical protein Enr13x_07050 [Stieleria neptunia]|uniref:Uncharacterized protein n=1 Tax=Stieleria neptunia TaxID=2527979 RepID=A0A518HJ83_9BACT|nr:hypothetical protein [Stieleria neptunia]QDV40869.1 hypothetical protein Enr13x_07050 [Stieleria neptunia]
MRRALCGVLLVVVFLCAVGFSDGPIRRLLFRNASVSRQVERNVCTGPNCANTPAAQLTETSPWVVGESVSAIAGPVVFAPPSPPVVSRNRTVAFAAPPAGSMPFDAAENLIETEASDGFRRAVIKASREARRSGMITVRDAALLRVALISPSFRQAAEDLAVTQMAFSGDPAVDELPRKTSGEIDRTAIDWEGFGAFMKVFIPLLVELLIAVGVGA